MTIRDRERFRDYLVVECGLANNTILAYDRDLDLFASYLQESNLECPQDVDRRTVILFLGWCRDLGHATSSLRRHVSCLRGYFRFLVSMGNWESNPAREIALAKDWQTLPHTLSPRQVDALIKASALCSPRSSQRNRAIIELLYSAGLRVSELCNLEQRECYAEEGFLRCRGKGNKQRIVPVGERAWQEIQKYNAGERQKVTTKHGPRSPLFLSTRGNAIGREQIYRMVKLSARSCGLANWVSPHSLRHSFASHLLAGGANLREVQELLGHADMRTTEIYTHVDRSRLMEDYKKHHPRA